MKPLNEYGVAPLPLPERGRQGNLRPESTAIMEKFCAQAMSDGHRQADIMAYVGASRSRVSRWCIAGLKKYGVATDHRLLNRRDLTLAQMLWARIDFKGPQDCWPWRGAIKNNGYGALNYRGKGHQAHRAVYETFIQAVPRDLVIDHLCENKLCVNPLHLKPVPQSVNICMGKVRGE